MTRNRSVPSPPHLNLGVLAVEGNLLSSLSAPGDLLRVAQKLALLRQPVQAPRFSCVLVSARGASSVALADGLRLEGLQAPPPALDVLIVPGMMHHSAGDLAQRVAAMAPEHELLRALHARGVRLASACSGSFLLAASGLLDGRRATTSWWLSGLFRQRFPRVRLEESELVLEDGNLLTCGAANAQQNLLLRLIAQVGGEALAQQTARFLLIDPERQSQAPYINQALIERPRHSLAEKAEKFLKRGLHQDISVAGLAEHCGTSERSLLRHFRSHFGATPLEHLQRLRVERAKALLESSLLSFDEIVERCGYSDVSSFRRLFKRATAMTPGDYRERYRLRAN